MAVRTYGRLTWSQHTAQWIISAEPQVVIRLKRALPRIKLAQHGGLTLHDTPDMAKELTWVTDRWPLEMNAETKFYLQFRLTQHNEREEEIQAILGGRRREGVMLEPAREPRPYQLEAADLVLATGRQLVVHAVGLGKTFTSLLTLREDDALPAVVVTLGGTLPKQWLGQLELAFPDMKGWVLPAGDMDTALRVMTKKVGEPDVFVVPYSRLAKWHPHLKDRMPTVIFDEVQELRHTGTDKYNAAYSLARSASYVVGLTATPIYNYGDEIWNISEVLEPDVLGERQEFLREWSGTMIGTAGNHSIEEIGPLSQYLVDLGFMHRKSRADVGRVMAEPERLEYEVDIDQQWLDGEMDDIALIAERFLAPGVKGIDKMQAGSEIDFRMREATGLAKADGVIALMKLLLESEERIILFGWHHAVYNEWLQGLRDYSPMTYTGKESATQKQAALDAFMGGDCRVLMMSLRAGAGIDGLQDYCDVAVFGELDWSPGIYIQNLGRIGRDHMDGRIKERQVVGYFCVCESGSDPVMMDVNGIKTQQADQFLDPTAEIGEATPAPANRIEILARQIAGRMKEAV